MLAIWLVGCHWFPPSGTSATGMAGFVLEPGGAPVRGLKIETLESSTATDDDGAFAIHYKRPETFVAFAWGGMNYRRAYRPEDEGRVVEVMLPPIRDLEVACGGFACALTLDWALGDGLTARWDGRCESGASARVVGAPQGLPSVACRPRVTEAPVALSTRFGVDRLELLPPARALQVSVTGDAAPETCEVWVNGVPAPWAGDGVHRAEAAGEAQVQVACEGRAALPVVAGPEATAVSVSWVAAGPELRAPPGMVFERLILTHEGEAGWRLGARATEGGGFLLPPLPAGRYTVQLHGGEPSRVPVNRRADPPEGRVTGQLLASGQYAGDLVLARERADGVLQAGVDE